MRAPGEHKEKIHTEEVAMLALYKCKE